MIAGYAIGELLALLREKYPAWDSFSHESFQAERVEPLRRQAKKARDLIRKGEFRRLLSAGDHAELWSRLERLGRQSTLIWTGSQATSDLAILYTVKAKGELWPFLEQMRALLFDQRPSPDRIDDFADYCSENELPNKWVFATFYLFFLRPHAEILVKPRLARWFLQFMGQGEIYTSTPSADMYERFKKSCHGLLAELKTAGATDMIDVFALLTAAYEISRDRVSGLALEAQIDLDRPLVLREDPPLYRVNPQTGGKNSEGDDLQIQPEVSRADLAASIGWPEADIANWLEAIDRKKQAIFYGPPGTGKTYIADKVARFLVGGGDGMRRTVQFHPAYDYADFIEGIRPITGPEGQLGYENRSGLFVRFCRAAAARGGQSVLLIDEINRANLSQVFGELMYLLEYRDEMIELAGGRQFKIPPQVIILGTMNTADRSIALIDHALRRRFAFIHLPPKLDLLAKKIADQRGVNGSELIALIEQINTLIGDPHFYVGISFFLTDRLAERLPQIWQMEIEPYLEELFSQQPEVLESLRWDKISQKLLL